MEDDKVLLGEADRIHKHVGHDGDSAIQETQMYDMYACTQT